MLRRETNETIAYRYELSMVKKRSVSNSSTGRAKHENLLPTLGQVL